MVNIKKALRSKFGWWTAIVLTVLNFMIISGFLTFLKATDSVIVGALTLGFVINPTFLIIRFAIYFIFGLGLEKLWRG